MYLRNSNNPTRRRPALVVLVMFVVMFVGASWTGVEAQEPRRNPEAQQLKNPVASDVESIEAGKKVYLRHCASCHGKTAKGDGGMSLSGGTPSDLTDETWDFGSTDGEIFVAIRDGVSADMLAYKDKLSDTEIWQTVVYLRSLGPKAKEAK